MSPGIQVRHSKRWATRSGGAWKCKPTYQANVWSALDEAVAAEPSAADELAVFQFDENGERVGEPITRAAA